MKRKNKIFNLFLLLTVLLFSCSEEEMKYIDPMVYGVTGNVNDEVNVLTSGSWSAAMVGYRAQRIKLLKMKNAVEQGSYSGDGYGLENDDLAKAEIESVLTMLNTKIDSVWDANIQDDFDAINANSEGIKQLGQSSYDLAAQKSSGAYAWISSDIEDGGGDPWAANQLNELKASLAPLTNLASLNDAEVIKFVEEIKAQFATIQEQYSGLAPEISSNAFFSKAQKDLYAEMGPKITDMSTTIESGLSLDTKDSVDLLERNLFGLTYFVANNNTSPAQRPVVFGKISSITELRWLSEEATIEELNNGWTFTADIDASETHRWNENKGFMALPKLAGTIDGQYHIISGIKLGPTSTKTAFVGVLESSGVIKNLGFYNASGATVGVQGGIVAGNVTGGTISKCFAHGSFGMGGQSGGLIGRPDGATIEDCFVNVDLTTVGGNQHGGLFGVGTGNVICKNVYSVGLVGSTNTHKGALIGNWGDVIEKLIISGLYYDASTAGLAGSVMVADVDAQLMDLTTDKWNDLANFTGFSPDVWEIKKVTEIDENPRPYLKGFNYEVINEMIVPAE